MPHVTLISPGHPSGSPRLVRDADALTRAGYTVRVLGVRFLSRLDPFDKELLRTRSWRYEAVECLTGFRAKTNWRYARLRNRVCRYIARRASWNAVDNRAYGYLIPELIGLATSGRTDLFISHQHTTLPVAAAAAARQRCSYMFDAEDLLSDCPSEPTHIVRRHEQTYLPGCARVSTMSVAAAEHLQASNRLPVRPLVLHNTPSIEERRGILDPLSRGMNQIPSIYWFGQTLGPHSCAESMIRALPLLCRPTRLVLRGYPIASYVDKIRRLAVELDVVHLVEIAGVAAPSDMVRLASTHDILLGSQPGADLFHQMAIGNKVFTGMMAGLALALTDTIAHRRLLEDIPGAGILYPRDNPEGIANQLNGLLQDSARLHSVKMTSWTLAGVRFNWEEESKILLGAVADALSAVPRAA